MKKYFYLLLLICSLVLGCDSSPENSPIIVSSEAFHSSIDKVTEIMIHDIFSPPVASRIFAYPNVAAYEIVALNDKEYISLVNSVNGLTPIPKPEADLFINYQLSALVAHMEVSKRLIFSEDRMEVFRDSLYNVWNIKNPKVFKDSKGYGLKVADHIAVWMNSDNYSKTRSMPRFTVETNIKSRWKPTPPAYMEGIEPHWNKIRPFLLDSAQQFKPSPPPLFSLEKNSKFYKELKEVYDISNEIRDKGGLSEEIAIAKFWDCNPYVSVTRGHLMFSAKKITPGAHWIGITKIAAKKTNSGFNKTVFAYTKTSMGIANAFISCWDEKYRSVLIRPVTLINEHLNENWKPVLQTPPFPEYTSGHSVVSGAASTILTNIFGDNFSFEDDTELIFGLPVRSFTSFKQATEEAAISRLYGGIHYRAAIDLGLEQGNDVGAFIVNKVKMEKSKKAVLNAP